MFSSLPMADERMQKVQSILQDYEMAVDLDRKNDQKQERSLSLTAICLRDSNYLSNVLQSSRIPNCSKGSRNEKHVRKR